MRDQFIIDLDKTSEAEKAFQELEKSIIKALDAHRFGIILFDPAGNLLTCNKQWERLYLVSYDNVKDYNLFDDTNLHGKHIWQPIHDAFNGTAGIIEENYFSPEEWNKVGRPRWTEGHVLPIFDTSKHGEILGTAIFLQDITERKITALEIEKLHSYLMETRNAQEHLVGRAEHDAGLGSSSSSAVDPAQSRRALVSIPRRERQIFEKLASGHSVKEAAHLLGIGIKSVYTYRTRLLKRLNLSTDVELAIAWRDIYGEPLAEHPVTSTNKP